MPFLDGIQLTKHLRHYFSSELNLARSQQPKIIGVSGHVEEHFIKQGLEAGMDFFESKPLYAHRLQALLRQMGLHWQHLAARPITKLGYQYNS